MMPPQKRILSIPQTLALPFHIPNSPMSPPLPAPPPAVFCIRPMYCLLTVFHAAIYFSMHVVKHFSSLDDNELPGVGMHFSKQWLFILDMSWRALLMAASCWTCFMRAALGSEALREGLRESMVVVRRDSGFRGEVGLSLRIQASRGMLLQ